MYKAKIFEKLSNCLENKPTEFWKILRSIQDKEEIQQEGLEELLLIKQPNIYKIKASVVMKIVILKIK